MKLVTLITASIIALSNPIASANDIDVIDAAANTLDIKTLKQLSQDLSGYDRAYANYRLAITATLSNQQNIATNALDDAAIQLTDASDTESQALLAAVYGMQIGMAPMKGVILGPKINATLDSANEQQPNNPRVLLVKAISAYNTPAMFGGGSGNAIEFSNQALEAYQQPCTDICWGHAEAYTWRGLAKQKLGDQQGAVNDWQQAVSTNPDYGWAKFLLSQATK